MFEAFARPWLLLLAPFIYGLIRLAFRQLQASSWQTHLPANLARRLLTHQEQPGTSADWPVWPLAALVTCFLSLALAGVGFPLQLQEAQRQQQEVVIIQHLAPTERGQADAVQQLETAQQLLVPFLNNRQQGQTALIFYAGSAHLASPMTSDAATLRQIISLAHPSVMPRRGDQPREALQLAAQTGQLATQPRPSGNPLYWLWLTDSLPPAGELQDLLETKPAAAELTVILTATAEISEQELRVVADLPLKLMAGQTARKYLQQLNQPEGGAGISEQLNNLYFQEIGHWLLLPAVLLLLWQYLGQPWPASGRFIRRQSAWLLPALIAPWLSLGSPAAQALSWQNPDYQAWQALNKQQPERVLEMTSLPRLLAEAQFQPGDYQQAARAYELALQTPPEDSRKLLDLQFNAGTAWLFAGDLERALELFDRVKEQQPQREDNCINRRLALSLQQQKTLPDEEELLKACGSTSQQKQPHNEQKSETSQPEDQSAWQPSARPECIGCLPLTPEQEQTLEQLEEDPWRLLRNRFQYELRERES